MSEVGVDLSGPETGTCDVQDDPCPDNAKPSSSVSKEASRPDLQGLVPAGHPSAGDVSGLLSLPWEVVTHIASHLPAQCVITVLPQVCHALGNVGKDSTAWQLRARRLTGSRANFPVGPREDFDWPTACLEMEQLITCWTNQAHRIASKTIEDEDEREQQRLQQRAEQDGEQVAEGQEDGREAEVEGVGVAAREVAYDDDEGLEVVMEGDDGEIQPIGGGDQVVRVREELEERLEEPGAKARRAAALMEEEMDRRMVFDANQGQGGALNPDEALVDPRRQSPSPPPALECITLPSGHIAQVNSVLLVGGEGAVCATGSRDWNVKLWDLQAGSGGTLLHTLGGQGDFTTHRGWVWCLASQGPLLASGGFDSTVRLWDLQASGAKRDHIRTGAAVLCLSWQTDVLLAGTFDKSVRMYDTRAANPLVKSICLHGNAVMCLAADDKYIISGSKDHTVAIYDRRAGKGLRNIRLKSYLSSMSYSGSEVWAGDNRGMLHSFSMQAGTLRPLSQFDVGHTALITGIHRSPGSLYTCSTDHTVKVHIPSAPPRTLCTLPHQAQVNGLSVDAGVLAVSSGDVCVEIWRPRKYKSNT